MLKSGDGSREYEIKDGNTTIRKVGDDIELEGRNIIEPCAYVEALPCNATLKDISSAFKVAWEIVQEESELGLKKGQEELSKLLQHTQQPTQTQSQQPKEQPKAAKTPDDVFVNWEVE